MRHSRAGSPLGEIDPSRCPPQPEGPGSSGDPTRTAIETLGGHLVRLPGEEVDLLHGPGVIG